MFCSIALDKPIPTPCEFRVFNVLICMIELQYEILALSALAYAAIA